MFARNDAQLKDFQYEDVQKLKSKRARLIGNEPGTGKTYEGLALDLLNRAGDGNAKVDLKELFPRHNLKTLIICPKSVIGSWDEHCMDLTEEDVYVVDSKNRKQMVADLKNPRTSGYFIVNWEFLRLELKELKNLYFFHIIADECHRAKNRKSQQTLALKQLRTVYKTAMSGTPADNKPQDLWSILNWLWPNYYTSFWRFVDAYIEVEKTVEGYRKFLGPNPDTIGFLHEEMEPWFVRRRKVDVLTDLPDKYYTRMWVDLDPKQRRAYDQMRKTMVAWVEEHEDRLGDPIIANAVVAQLIRLQQYAAGYLIPLLDESGEHVHKLRHKGHKRGEYCTDLCMAVPQYQVVDPSSKLDTLMELLEDRPDEQIIVFSQFKSVIKLLASRLDAKAIPYGLLTGDVNQDDRARNVQEFQARRTRVFAGTIAAGGVGITLTASSTVVFLDRSWSPAINTQAEDRAHRIGQADAVEVIDLLARNTVDLGRHQQLELKGKWLAMLLGDEVPTATIMNTDITLDAIEVDVEEE